MSKLVEKNGKKYKVDGEFYIAEDESHIIYRGVKFNWFDNYYRRHTFSKGVPSNLHRAVWIDHFGPIPPGHHIHHKDRNARNNHVENLQCLEGKLHLSRSAKNSTWVGSAGNLEVLRKMREKAKSWHTSKEGRQFHSQHAKKIKFGYKLVIFKRKCDQCEKDYECNQHHGRFCSRKCKSNYRYHTGVDNENRKCTLCDKYFIVNRYSRTKTCGKPCSTKLWRIVNGHGSASEHKQKEE